MNTDLVTYYKERAHEYELVYQKPERQEELRQATAILQDIFSGKHVFEIACGTGYWTERLAAAANFILATDINETMLDVAKAKTYPADSVTFRRADLFNLPALAAKYESLFGGFIFSHIRLQELQKFISILNSRVVPGGTVVLLDNNYVEESSLPVSEQDEAGNTYQTRTLADGSTHLVLKNFPVEQAVRELLQGKATDIHFTSLRHYWILSYKTLPQEV